MREHMSCNDLAVSEGGCAGENCRLPVCVVCGRDWPCPVQLQAENAALIGIVEKATAAVQRIQELRDEWSRDDAESLTRFGHHMPIALGAAAEMLTRAIDGGAE